METLAQFFDRINELLGVSGPGELIFHPVFIGLCLAALIYSVIKGYKFSALAIFGLLVGGVIFNYLYPEDSSDLHELIKFLAAMGGLALVIVYLGFVRE